MHTCIHYVYTYMCIRMCTRIHMPKPAFPHAQF